MERFPQQSSGNRYNNRKRSFIFSIPKQELGSEIKMADN
jgi:hypothetical protein